MNSTGKVSSRSLLGPYLCGEWSEGMTMEKRIRRYDWCVDSSRKSI